MIRKGRFAQDETAGNKTEAGSFFNDLRQQDNAMAPEKKSEDAQTNLDDDMVKLVAYTIVSLKRDKEKVMEEGEGTILVKDRMTSKTFTAWIIGKYFQEKKDVLNKEYSGEDKEDELKALLKYLRVHYVVSYRWPRQPLEYEEREIAVLEGIRNKI